MTNTKTAAVLDAAADLIEAAPKLAKGTFYAPASALTEDGREIVRYNSAGGVGFDTCYCAMGAIFEAYNSLPDRLGFDWDITAALHSHIGAPGADPSYIYAWNDAPERTKDEVVQALRGAAQTVREEVVR